MTRKWIPTMIDENNLEIWFELEISMVDGNLDMVRFDGRWKYKLEISTIDENLDMAHVDDKIIKI